MHTNTTWTVGLKPNFLVVMCCITFNMHFVQDDISGKTDCITLYASEIGAYFILTLKVLEIKWEIYTAYQPG